MNKYLKIGLSLALVGILGVGGYYTHKLWVFAGKSSKYMEYLAAGLDCMIMENGQNEGDVGILFGGFKSRKAYYEAMSKEAPGLYSKEEIQEKIKRPAYNSHIPECKKFYSQYRCWMLDPHEPASLDGCGLHFGLTQSEIDEMKAEKDYDKVNALMDKSWKRRQEEHEAKGE